MSVKRNTKKVRSMRFFFLEFGRNSTKDCVNKGYMVEEEINDKKSNLKEGRNLVLD